MCADSDLAARLARLYERRQFAMKLGLDTIQALAMVLDNPQAGYAVVHIAGTNGKGSTGACIEAVLRAAGFRTGFYTSPHLVRFNERIRINGTCISDAVLAGAMDRLDAACLRAGLTGARDPTFFEYATALAFDLFRQAEVQVAVVETGLGGRLDATNIVTPAVAVITPVGMDHAEHLGATPEAIAAEKGGIIKPGQPVVSAPQREPVMRVISRLAAERDAPLSRVDHSVTVTGRPSGLSAQKIRYDSGEGLAGSFTLPLAGEHQVVNAATALLAVEVLFRRIGIPLEVQTVRAGLGMVRWPGRFTQLESTPPLFVDAAHNPDGAVALARLLRRRRDMPVGLVIGMCADKDVESTVGTLAPAARQVWAVPVANPRSADPARIAAAAGRTPTTCCASLQDGLEAARHWAREQDGMVCVTGSIFLIGDLYTLLKRDPYET